MKHGIFAVLLATAGLLGCPRQDPWAVCRGFGAVGYGTTAPTCTDPQCRACADQLSEAWRARGTPEGASRIRIQFMRTPAAAREAFALKEHPDGRYPFDHCVAGPATPRSCAALGRYCTAAIPQGLSNPELALGDRAQLERASIEACPEARTAIVDELQVCLPFPGDDACTSPSCRRCVVGHLAAVTVLGPLADRAPNDAAFDRLLRSTPEPVARTIAERLGGPDTLADIEPTVIQRALRGYCFRLVATSATPAPFACNAVMTRFLTHLDYPDSSKAWSAIADARPAVRAQCLEAFLLSHGADASLDGGLNDHLRSAPPAGTDEALRAVMGRATVSDAMYQTYRAVLEAHGATGAQLPPATRTLVPTTGAGTAPSPAPAHPQPSGDGVTG